VITAILLGVAGTPIVFVLSMLIAWRLSGRSATAPARLSAARDRLSESPGPADAFLLLYGAGIFVLTAVGLVLGEISQRVEDPVDWPVFHWIEDVQDDGWARPMNVLGQMGNIGPTRLVAVVAIVVLTAAALARRERWWVPAVLIGGTVLVQKFDQAALAKIVDRGHPPTTLGTYPSGGCARILAIYGVIMFLVLAYLRAGRLVRACGWSLIVTMAFAEGYTRLYLNKHWVTDVLGGWAVGGMMLAVTVFAGATLLSRSRPSPAEGSADGGSSDGRAAGNGRHDSPHNAPEFSTSRRSAW
jgi:membrane-associated phospholipid phosphatase